MRTTLGRLLLLGLCVGTSSGCANLIFGRYEKVDIVTEPSGVAIYDSEGFNVGMSPVEIPLKRRPRQQLTFRKEGFFDTTVVMSSTVNIASIPVIGLSTLISGGINNDTELTLSYFRGGMFKKRSTQFVIRMEHENVRENLDLRAVVNAWENLSPEAQRGAAAAMA